MPTAFLVLSRFFLRVDGVIVKILDTRVYHQFGTSILIREFKERVLGFEALVKLLPISLNGKPDMTLLTNMDYVSKLMDDSCVVRCLTDHMLV
jgi:type 2A phosphatase activator TIP41